MFLSFSTALPKTLNLCRFVYETLSQRAINVNVLFLYPNCIPRHFLILVHLTIIATWGSEGGLISWKVNQINSPELGFMGEDSPPRPRHIVSDYGEIILRIPTVFLDDTKAPINHFDSKLKPFKCYWRLFKVLFSPMKAL